MVVLYISCAVDPQSNTPLTHILLRAILGVLQILVGKRFLHNCGGILNTIDCITSNFDGIYHQTFRAAKTSLDTVESDSDDEEEYVFQRNKFGALIYEPKPARKEDSDGLWHAEVRLTDPYGNIYDQGFVTKKTTRKLAKYHKLSDIMSPN
nr:hypothetical protein [Tanacetum cinerariifolium]